MTSEKQIEANRKNAKLSTGAKDTSKTRLNATKFGVFSKEMIIQNPFFKENIEEFSILHNLLHEEYSPQTSTEHIMVEKIFDCCWRLKRLRRVETAIISKQMYELPRDLVETLKVFDSLKFSQKSKYENFSELPYASEEFLEEYIEKLKEDISQKQGGKEVTQELKKMLDMFEVLLDFKTKQITHFAQIGQNLALVLPEKEMTNFTAYEKSILNQMFTTIAILRRLKGWD